MMIAACFIVLAGLAGYIAVSFGLDYGTKIGLAIGAGCLICIVCAAGSAEDGMRLMSAGLTAGLSLVGACAKFVVYKISEARYTREKAERDAERDRREREYEEKKSQKESRS